MSSENSSYLIVSYRGDDGKPVYLYDQDTLVFTLRDVPLDSNEVEFEMTMTGPNMLVIDTAITMKTPNTKITGLEPGLGSEGVKKIANSNRS